VPQTPNTTSNHEHRRNVIGVRVGEAHLLRVDAALAVWVQAVEPVSREWRHPACGRSVATARMSARGSRFLAGTRYRPDKNAEEADTSDDLRALLRRSGGRAADLWGL